MDKEEFCSAYVAWFPENEERYREHKREFPHILLHVFSVFAVNIPMAEAYEGKDRAGFEKFCSSTLQDMRNRLMLNRKTNFFIIKLAFDNI